MSAGLIASKAPWLAAPSLQSLLELLSQGGEDARIAGGAVRNALLGEQVADIDIATTVLPDEVVRRAEAAGFKVAPTGIEHGTVTVVVDGEPYEVTTLRADIETDGRRAKVAFGRDWKADAERRDFTINGLYATAAGEIVDLVGGVADIESRTIRFIGDAAQRIREDYLRILRFFRFFAWYGHGRPDADGLRASTRLKDGLDQLSVERVWSELKKLLAAPDPSRALLWMRQTGVLTKILPESEKWGIDAIHGLVSAERELHWTPDPLLRIAAIVPPDAARMEGLAARLKMANADRERLTAWAGERPPKHDATELDLAKRLYRGNAVGLTDSLKLALAAARARAVTDTPELISAAGYARLLKFAANWEKPDFPLRGADLRELGMQPDASLGALLKQLEAGWVDSGFKLSRDALLNRAASELQKS